MLSMLVLSQMALAQSEVVEESEIPKVWIECAPMSGLLQLESMLPDGFRRTTKGLGKAGIEGFVQAGGDADGVMRAFGQDGLILEIPFNGTSDQVGGMIELLQPDNPYWQMSDSTWRVEGVDDAMVVTLDSGKLSMSSVGQQIALESPPEMMALEQKGATRQDGCWIVVNSDATIPKTKIPLDGGVFVPFGDGPFSVLYTPDEPLPTFFEPVGGQAMRVSTNVEPAVVGVLGFDWDVLFNDPDMQERMGLTPKEARKIAKRLRIQPGGLIASQEINIRNNPQIAVGLELHNRFGQPQCPWLIWRGVKRSLTKSGLDPMVLDKHLLSFENNGQAIYISVDKGRLMVANTRLLVDEMTLNQGTPWVNESLQNLASEQPLALQIRIPTMVGMMAGGIQSVEMGLGPVESMVHLSIHPTFAGSAGWTGLLPFIAGQLPEPSPESEVAEFERRIQDLAAKEHAAFYATGQYQPVGRTGMFTDPDLQVDLSIVDSAPVVESAVSLGWMEQPQDGLYWVETTEDSFVVHGLVFVEGQFLHVTKDQTGLRTIDVLD